MQNDIYEDYDDLMSALTVDEIQNMISDQIENPGLSTKNYYMILKGRLNRDEQINLANEVIDRLSEKFGISVDENARDSTDTVQIAYNLYLLFIINIIPAMAIFLKEYIFTYSKKKSFLKTYGHIKPHKSNKVHSREAYIIFTDLKNIIKDVCTSEITLYQFLEYVAKDSTETISDYIKDLLDEDTISEENSVRKMYEILSTSHMLESIQLKIAMDYKQTFVSDDNIGFTPSEEYEINEDYTEEHDEY